MATVYVVTEGSYSDYHIEAVFSTKQRADDYIKRWNREAYAEKWEIDEIDPYQHPDLIFWRVKMWRDGNTLDVDTIVPDGRSMEDEILTGEEGSWRPQALLFVHCWAKDEQHAVKIANERRTRAIAEGRM